MKRIILLLVLLVPLLSFSQGNVNASSVTFAGTTGVLVKDTSTFLCGGFGCPVGTVIFGNSNQLYVKKSVGWKALASSAGTVSSATLPLVISGSNISIPKSTTAVNGYLAAADFTLFNDKLTSGLNGLTSSGSGSGSSVVWGGSLLSQTKIDGAQDVFFGSTTPLTNFDVTTTGEIAFNSPAVKLIGFTGGSVPYMNGTTIAQNNASLFWDNTNSTLYTGGNTGGTAFTALRNFATGTTNSYLQTNVQNLSNGINASSDIVATSDNGTDALRFVNLGINSSGNTSGGILNGANTSYLISNGNYFAQGTTDAHSMYFFTGGTAWSNKRFKIDSVGIITSVGKHNFTPTATLAGLNIGTISGAPSTLSNGDIWYNSAQSSPKFYAGSVNSFLMYMNSTTAAAIPFINASNTAQFTQDAANFNYSSGVLSAPRIKSSGSAPATAAGTGAGTGPTITLTAASDMKGTINVTTGTTPAASSVIVTLTFNVAYLTTAPTVVITPANAVTATLSGTTMVYPTSTVTTLVLNSNTAALTASTAYSWTYHVLQ